MESLLPSEQLKIHTQKVHTDLEQTLIPKIRSIHSKVQYAELLKLFYTFYKPVETRLATIREFENLTAGLSVRKADSLKDDILALGESMNDLPLCTELPTIGNKSQALGVMYVLEGSVLGGKVIAGLITKQIATDQQLPFSFFLHYGSEAHVKWQQFKTRIDSSNDISLPDLFSAAEDTFLLFKQWVHKRSDSVNIPSLQR